ncbi:RNA polymerase sigma factor [Cohnella sp. GCM10027633]|uniref:RNA polymerase sigma factor n=1 Tax=unclassified Cohnella TaxID=2636738 RepID=UPI00363A1B97
MTETIRESQDIRRLQGALGRFCLSLTASRWDAEDLSQETWLKALESEAGLAHANPEAFLLRIARNAWIDRTRQNGARSRALQAVRSEAAPYALPDEGVLGIESALNAIMAHLTPLQCAVWLLRDACGYSAAESALGLGITVGAVKAALHRARAALPAAKEAIAQGTLPAPLDEGLKDVLRTLAIAYEGGDIGTMLAILRQGETDPVPAMAALQSRRLRAVAAPAKRDGAAPLMGLAA